MENKRSLLPWILVATLLATHGIYATESLSLDNDYLPYLQIGGTRFFNVKNSASATGLDLFMPLWQLPTHLIFTDLRVYDRSGTPIEANAHFGYRYLLPEQQLYGIYGAFDRKQTNLKNYFNQLTLGGEYWWKSLFLGANFYQPIGKTLRLLNTFESASLKEISSNLYNIWITNNKQYEQAMGGIDAEAGYEFTPGLIAYIGGYYFYASEVESIYGPKAKLTYDWSWQNGQKILGIFDKFGVELGVQNDRPRGTIWYLNANVRIGLIPNSNVNLSGVSHHMIDLVRRDVDIISTKAQKNSHEVYQENGQEMIIGIYNNDEQILENIKNPESPTTILAKTHHPDNKILNVETPSKKRHGNAINKKIIFNTFEIISPSGQKHSLELPPNIPITNSALLAARLATSLAEPSEKKPKEEPELDPSKIKRQPPEINSSPTQAQPEELTKTPNPVTVEPINPPSAEPVLTQNPTVEPVIQTKPEELVKTPMVTEAENQSPQTEAPQILPPTLIPSETPTQNLPIIPETTNAENQPTNPLEVTPTQSSMVEPTVQAKPPIRMEESPVTAIPKESVNTIPTSFWTKLLEHRGEASEILSNAIGDTHPLFTLPAPNSLLELCYYVPPLVASLAVSQILANRYYWSPSPTTTTVTSAAAATLNAAKTIAEQSATAPPIPAPSLVSPAGAKPAVLVKPTAKTATFIVTPSQVERNPSLPQGASSSLSSKRRVSIPPPIDINSIPQQFADGSVVRVKPPEKKAAPDPQKNQTGSAQIPIDPIQETTPPPSPVIPTQAAAAAPVATTPKATAPSIPKTAPHSDPPPVRRSMTLQNIFRSPIANTPPLSSSSTPIARRGITRSMTQQSLDVTNIRSPIANTPPLSAPPSTPIIKRSATQQNIYAANETPTVDQSSSDDSVWN